LYRNQIKEVAALGKEPLILGGMKMEVTTKQFRNCDLVSVSGRVDSSTAPQLAEALENVTGNGRYKIVLDMSGLEYMSSAGFRSLLASQRLCKRYNRGEIVLASVPERIQEALELAGFTELFKTYADPIDAVGSF
jgi:anti-sigma B factor antagonist